MNPSNRRPDKQSSSARGESNAQSQDALRAGVARRPLADAQRQQRGQGGGRPAELVGGLAWQHLWLPAGRGGAAAQGLPWRWSVPPPGIAREIDEPRRATMVSGLGRAEICVSLQLGKSRAGRRKCRLCIWGTTWCSAWRGDGVSHVGTMVTVGCDSPRRLDRGRIAPIGRLRGAMRWRSCTLRRLSPWGCGCGIIRLASGRRGGCRTWVSVSACDRGSQSDRLAWLVARPAERHSWVRIAASGALEPIFLPEVSGF